MRKKDKSVCTAINYIEHFLTLASVVTEWISISGFASILNMSLGITILAIGLKICAVTAWIKKYKSIIKKQKKNYDKIVLLVKSKLNSIEVLISKV